MAFRQTEAWRAGERCIAWLRRLAAGLARLPGSGHEISESRLESPRPGVVPLLNFMNLA
jgi:hypothetical protein